MSQTTASTSSNPIYQSIFDGALEAHKKKTKKDLLSHPLFFKLETCNSPGAVLTALLEQICQQDLSRSIDDKLTKWLNPTVNVIYNFSQAIGGGVSLVSLNGRRLTCPRYNVIALQVYPPAGVIFTGIGVLLSVSIIFGFIYFGLPDIRLSHPGGQGGFQ